jgi:membrane-bound lytic murein transglycosylase D
MKLTVALFFVVAFSAAAQPYEVPQVPHKLNFAGISLTIRDDARREIQKDVDALWQSPRHFNSKAERAKTYFPIIEKIFAEERVPDDFKYLVLQESALIADAVSVSNAVGFWQFKDFTAMEMGLRVDDTIDERMNIASASRGAAKYIKKNNYRFNNWVYALQAYQMGAGGVLRSVPDTESGAKHMNITSSTYWYVKKFLAHKIAFEKVVEEKPLQPISTLENNQQRSVEDIARDLSISPEELLAYNKWIRKGNVPDDRTYAIIVPLPENRLPSKPSEPAIAKKTETATKAGAKSFILINGIPALKAQAGESMTALAKRAGVSLPSFMSYNDLQGHEKIVAGTYYYAENKKSKGAQSHAIAKSGEDLWSISQQYGVTMKKLKKYNRTDSKTLQPGQQVWLASKKPKQVSTDFSDEPTVAVGDRYFNWGASVENTAIKSITVLASASHEPVFSSMPASAMTVSPAVHIVQAGENIHSVAKKYDLDVQELKRWNQLGDNVELQHGQQLNLQENTSPTASASREEIEHEVQPSDTLYGIARQYGVTIKELMDWNQKKDFGLTVGEKLKVFKN